MLSKINLALAIVAVIVLLFIGRFIYNSGYLSGQVDKQKEFDEYKEQIADERKAQADRIEQAEQQLAESAKRYEALRDSYEETVLDNQKWKEQHAETKNRSLSLPTVQRLNYLLSR